MTNDHDTTRLSDYLDGGLAPPDRAELERHLAECEECARRWQEFAGGQATLESDGRTFEEVAGERRGIAA